MEKLRRITVGAAYCALVFGLVGAVLRILLFKGDRVIDPFFVGVFFDKEDVPVPNGISRGDFGVSGNTRRSALFASARTITPGYSPPAIVVKLSLWAYSGSSRVNLTICKG